LLELLRVSFIENPEPGFAPEIPTEVAPIVQVNVLAIDDVKPIAGPVALQMAAVAPLVTVGAG
jgi:hypothetical protein